jgi:septum formation topological specificity factor MinE
MSLLTKLGNMMKGGSSSTASAPKSANRAKERLSVILASQRNSSLLEGVNMEALQKDVLEVVRRHIAGVAAHVQDENGIKCGVKKEGNVAFFEMSVEIDAAASSSGAGAGAGSGARQGNSQQKHVNRSSITHGNRGHRTVGVSLNPR